MSVLLIAEHNNKELKSFTLNAATAAFQIDSDAMLILEGKKDTTKWDNLRYGRNRLGRYYACKKELLAK